MPIRMRTPRDAVACAGLCLAAALTLAGAAHATPAPPFRELLQQASGSAPRLAERQAEARAAEGRARQAAARLNPSVSVEVENFAGQAPFDGVAGAESTLSISQPFELGGKRSARIAVARAEVDVARARERQALAELGFNLAIAYGEAEIADLRLTIAREALDLAQTDARVARVLVEAGREAELRIIQADAAVSAARADLGAAQAERTTALARLTATAGSGDQFTDLSDSILDLAEKAAGTTFTTPVSTPEVLAAEAERDAAERRIRVERLRSRPDVTVSLGVRRFEEQGASALVAGVSLPIPIFDQNRGATAAATADLQAAEARLSAARLDAEADRRAALAQAEPSAARLESAKAGETSAAEAYRLSRLGYEAGRVPLAEVVSARRSLAEARGRTLEAFQARLRAEATIARLQSRPPFGAAE